MTQTHTHHPKLNEWLATAICGNDILSSCLYVSGIAILFAGVFAPLVLLGIGCVLFLYKMVYTEVVEALPINGGAYNCLLNGTSKTVAAVAGVMTLLSYVATAVISAKVAVEYMHTVIHSVPVLTITIVLLLLFAVLVITGLKDSARVAFGIFIFHICTMVLFLIFGLVSYMSGVSFLSENLLHTRDLLTSQGGLLPALYLAFSASLLGVSGFESSANFVEEQDTGVFRKTLRNMLIGVVFFNPLIALVVLNSMPYEAIIAAKDFLLADAAYALGGHMFQYFVVADAFAVLSGAVLTAYVGVSGLVHRMASDSCLPNFLTKENENGAFPRIIISFFLLCSSILLVTRGDLLALAGVYTIAFLGVMCMFALGNLILKEHRKELKRTYAAPTLVVILAFLATFFGIFGNIRIDPNNLRFFAIYFIPSLVLVLVIIYQDAVLRFALRISKTIFLGIHNYIFEHFEDIKDGKFVVFIHHVSRLHKILDYIDRNETGWHIILVHCKKGEEDEKNRDPGSSFEEIREAVPQLQKVGVFPHFDIKVIYKDQSFGPKVIEEVSKEYKVRKNRILIGSIHHFHPYDYADLGGVRIIF